MTTATVRLVFRLASRGVYTVDITGEKAKCLLRGDSEFIGVEDLTVSVSKSDKRLRDTQVERCMRYILTQEYQETHDTKSVCDHAYAIGVSERTFRDAQVIYDHGKELVRRVESGEITFTQAKRIAREKRKTQRSKKD